MDYKEFKNSIIDYLSENLSDEKAKKFEDLMAKDAICRKEFLKEKQLWEGFSVNTVPSSNMDMNFYSMLKEEEKKANKVSLLHQIQNLFSSKPIQQLTYALTILVIGFFIGKGINTSDNLTTEKIEMAQKETENVRSQLVLTLLEQPSANKRLQAVNEVSKLNKVTETIIKALFSTLNNDENVNVRLSAVEALKKYTDIPEVREGLVTSIVHQNSPLVQMELADLMVVLQEKKAVKSLEKIIQEEDVNSSVKEKVKESIQNII